jgi:hypothetical protein
MMQNAELGLLFWNLHEKNENHEELQNIRYRRGNKKRNTIKHTLLWLIFFLVRQFADSHTCCMGLKNY